MAAQGALRIRLSGGRAWRGADGAPSLRRPVGGEGAKMAGRYATSSSQGAPPASVRERVEAALGSTFQAWSKPDTGLTPSHRFIVALADGRRVFVKAAANPQTAAWLRNERLALASAPPKFTARRRSMDRRWRRCPDPGHRSAGRPLAGEPPRRGLAAGRSAARVRRDPRACRRAGARAAGRPVRANGRMADDTGRAATLPRPVAVLGGLARRAWRDAGQRGSGAGTSRRRLRARRYPQRQHLRHGRRREVRRLERRPPWRARHRPCSLPCPPPTSKADRLRSR